MDPSQVIQFFRSKDALFATVMAVPASALERFDAAFEGPEDGLGERVVRAYLESWEGVAAVREPLMAMLRGAIVHETAATELRDFIQSRLVNGVHDLQGRSDESTLRAGLAASMLIGMTIGRRVVGVPAVASVDTDTLVATVAPAVQVILTGA